MKKANQWLVRFLLSVSCCLLLAGCSNSSADSAADREQAERRTSSPTAENGISSPSAENVTSPAAADQEEIKICLVGNSLIDYGRQSYYLGDIAKSYGRQVSVDKLAWGGSFLRDYVKGTYISKKEIKKRLKQSDMVVFQDYGGWQGQETLRSIRKLEQWCKKDAAYYYYMYEEDDLIMDASDYKALKKLGAACIPKGQMLDAMYDMSYSYEELHMENDYHPNNFNGYLSALVMHGVIFGEPCAAFPREWFLGERAEELSRPVDDIIEALHGDSEEEVWEEFTSICEKADQLIQKAEKLPKTGGDDGDAGYYFLDSGVASEEEWCFLDCK